MIKKNILSKSSVDAVFLWDVFEHITNPAETLENINYVLKTSGFLIINTLNIDNPTVKLFRKNWSHYDPPKHLFYFSLKTLQKYLEKKGFSIIKRTTNGPLFYDDIKNKYLFGKSIFSSGIVNRFTNKLNLGYVQFIFAQKK